MFIICIMEKEIKQLFKNNVIQIIPTHVKTRYNEWKKNLMLKIKNLENINTNLDQDIITDMECINELKKSTIFAKNRIINIINNNIELTKNNIKINKNKISVYKKAIEKINNDYEQDNYKYFHSAFGIEYYIDNKCKYRFD